MSDIIQSKLSAFPSMSKTQLLSERTKISISMLGTADKYILYNAIDNQLDALNIVNNHMVVDGEVSAEELA